MTKIEIMNTSFTKSLRALVTAVYIITPTIILFSCDKGHINQAEITYTFSIDSVLNDDGTKSLELDANGYYLITLDSSYQTKQTIHRITGTILQDSLEPWPPAYVNWESSHVWITSDTVGYLVRRVINALGQWTIVDTNYINVPSGVIVPTLNPTSVSGRGGEINVIIAPIYGMKGDTMIISASVSAEHLTYGLHDTVKIILR